jgi:uncharacterized cupredoxin-like copper-binding protein
MRTQAIAGWVAVVAGVALAVGVLVAAVAPGVAAVRTDVGGASWPMGSGMMGGSDHMGGGSGMRGMDGMGGMMGFKNAGPAATAIPGAAEVRVDAANFSFSPSEIRLPRGAEINLTLANPAGNGVVHDLTVPSLGIHIVANAGETRTIGLRGLTAGRYDAYCSVPGHASLGMRATVVVE